MPKALSDNTVKWAIAAIVDVVARRRLQGVPIPAGFLKAHQELTSAEESHGSESAAPAAELKNEDLINSDEAARILGFSRRWVTELRTDLEGRKVKGKWLFPRQHVTDYAESRNADRVA